MTYKDYRLWIWDRGPDEFGGGGFQDKDGWVIEVIDPEDDTKDNILEIELSDKESNQLGLYKDFEGVDMWNRDLGLWLSEFVDNYDVPDRVVEVLESLPD